MEQPTEPYESFIERQSPEIVIGINVNGERLLIALNYDNALLVTHAEEYKEFDHAVVLGAAERPIYIWRPMDGEGWPLEEQLLQGGFDHYDRHYPSLEDEQHWFNSQLQDLGGL